MIEEKEFDKREKFKKLTLEYINDLVEVSQGFLNINKKMYDLDELLNTILMGTIAFTFQNIEILSNAASNPGSFKKIIIESLMNCIEKIK